MVIKFLLLLIAFHVSVVLGQTSTVTKQILHAYKIKNCNLVIKIYRDNKIKDELSENLIIQKTASFCFNKQKKFKEAIQIKIDILRRQYLSEHKKITKLIKSSESIETDEYPEKLKILYWNILLNYTNKILDSDLDSAELRKDFSHFTTFQNILTQLEFKEDEVDKRSDQVASHITRLKARVYKLTTRLFVDYLSWQQEMKLSSPTGGYNSLSVTNSGVCAGGAIGVENASNHFFVDGCLVYGSGSVGAINSSPTYKQGQVPVYGLKTSVAAGLFLSPNKTEIGLKIPLLYSVQKLTDPPQDSFSGYRVKGDGANLSVLTSIYFRWPFDAWFFQTDFGRFIDQDSTLWSIGVGHRF